jgi:hypothetical protein
MEVKKGQWTEQMQEVRIRLDKSGLIAKEKSREKQSKTHKIAPIAG